MVCRRCRAIEITIRAAAMAELIPSKFSMRNYFVRYDENISAGHTRPLAYVKLHQFSGETMCGRKRLSEKGRIQQSWMFFFAHMNCLDCKKLLSCLAVLWKGPVFKLHSAPDYQRYWLDRREQNVADAMLV
jgi:hypothetical protein